MQETSVSSKTTETQNLKAGEKKQTWNPKKKRHKVDLQAEVNLIRTEQTIRRQRETDLTLTKAY